MGVVEIPSDPQGPGRLSVVLDLSKPELDITIARLKEALSRLQHAGSLHRLSSPQPPPQAAAAAVAKPAEAPPPAGGTITTSHHSAPSVIRTHLSEAPATAPQRVLPKPAPLPIPLPEPSTSLPQPFVASSLQLPPHAPPAATQPPWQPRSGADVSFAAWTKPEPPPAEEKGPQWKICWRTDQGDHNSEAITSLVYRPSLSGLPSGDGHAGWLISASRQLLNLWECSASGGRGEPSLQFMHQQTTETVAWNLAAEAGTGLLLAAAQDPGRPTCCVALHSLHAESGLFAPRGRMPLPPIGAPAAPVPQNNSFSQVVSLHPLGGPLTTCCAASFGCSIVVYPTTIAPGELPKSKAAWVAHSADVTSLHRSQHGMQLFSGARDGSIHMWDLKAKPSQPSVSFRHNAAVTGLELVNDRHLVTCSMDGHLFLWDVRRPLQPLRNMASPDGSGIVKMAVSPFGDSAAFGTMKGGLFCAPVVLDEAPEVTCLPHVAGPVAALAWNTSTGELYAASHAIISVLQSVL